MDWTTLRHAYGDATDVPAILETLSRAPTSDAWNKLWSRVCHQGTVYSASYAVLPHLRDLAAKLPPAARVNPLGLAGAILSAHDVQGTKPVIDGLGDVVRDLDRIALESLAAAAREGASFIYMLEATLAFEGESFWGRNLDHLADGEFMGVCPSCDAQVHLAIGSFGFFATKEDWVNRPSVPRVPIRAAAAEQLPTIGRWMFDHALRAGATEIAGWIPYVFGATECPACSAPLSVADAIVALEGA